MKRIRSALKDYKNDIIPLNKVMRLLEDLPYKDLGEIKVDLHRSLRKGFPEVVYGHGKSQEEIVRVSRIIHDENGCLLVTRTNRDVYNQTKRHIRRLKYDPLSGMMYVAKKRALKKGMILVVAAGTSDKKVAQEAAVTAKAMGNNVKMLMDVGVAGIHRLTDNFKLLKRANVLIVVAGMEGALASVVGGLVSKPVIAVPTSVGYGASFRGIAPLLTMLNSCSPGVAVVNIDNGFGAGYFASLINR